MRQRLRRLPHPLCRDAQSLQLTTYQNFQARHVLLHTYQTIKQDTFALADGEKRPTRGVNATMPVLTKPFNLFVELPNDLPAPNHRRLDECRPAPHRHQHISPHTFVVCRWRFESKAICHVAPSRVECRAPSYSKREQNTLYLYSISLFCLYSACRTKTDT